jgi:outer membrane protein assembly factor BamB
MFRLDPAHTADTSISGPSTPKVLWTFSDDSNSIEGSPAVVDGKLYVGSANGNVYCLNATNGHQIWLNFKINAEIQSSPTVVNNFLYFCARDGGVYCLNAQTGEIVWKFQTKLGMGTSPTVVNGYVYASSQDGNLYCLNALDGKEVWRYSIISLAGPASPYDEIHVTSGSTSPAVVDGYVYVGGTHFFCLNANSGALIWSFSANVATSPTVFEGKVYFSARDKNAYCLDASMGSIVWEKPIITSELFFGTSPAVSNGLVCFGSWVQCVDASTGDRIWRYGTGDIYAAYSPTIAGEYAYFCGNDGNTYCVKASSGEYVWKSRSGGGSPVAVNGVLYVAGGSLIAFGDAGTLPTPTLPTTPYHTSSPIHSGSTSNVIVFQTQIMIVFALVVAAISATILLYITIRKGNMTQTNFRKRFILPAALVLTFIIAVSSAVALYTNNRSLPIGASSSNHSPATLLWQTSIEHYATGMAIADGKVFITTYQGTYAYDSISSQFIWKNNDVPAIGVQVYNGSVYVGGFGSVVYRLDENSGEKILSYQAPAASNIAWKGTPSFVVADGKVVAMSGDGIAVFDANSGGLYWTIGGLFNYPFYPYPQPTLGELSRSANPSNYIYILYGGRVDANNGKMLWNTGNHVATNYIITENKVIFWNFWIDQAHPNNILCVDASSGRTLWQFNSGISIYQPTIHDGFLLLPRTDGTIYALRILDGSLAWKAQCDSQGMMKGNNLPAEAKSFSAPSVSPIVVDAQTNIATWGFLVTQHQINGTNGNDLYVGEFSSIALLNGTIVRTSKVQTNGTISNGASLGLAPGEKELYLAAGKDLWAIDKASGNPTLIQDYESSTGPIILYNNTVYIATDLYLSSYK